MLKRLISFALALTSCRSTPPAPIDFGYGRILLAPKFRFDPRQTVREPSHASFAFDLVHDTHLNGQTSYAEKLIVSRLSPTLTQENFRALLAKNTFDPLPTKSPFTTHTEGPLEIQTTQSTYERHPVTEPATLIRLIDLSNRLVLSWYGFAKRYSTPSATAYLTEIRKSLTLDPTLDSRFPSYETWQGNQWMDVYYANQPLLTEALKPLGLQFPDQSFIGDLSTWQTSGQWMLALDGERPASLHLIQLNAQSPCSTIDDISPDLRPSFLESLPNKKAPECFRLHKRNFWQPPPPDSNPFTSWLQSIK